MIVGETADRFRFVTQPAHAELAGQFADRWGNEGFERPEPFAAAAIAAYNHDAGWWAYDRRPHLGDDGRPVDFRDMPPGTWIDLYGDGIDTVVGMDPYAGLLVSMHGSGLRRRRYGLSPSWPDTPTEYAAFVDREESRQARLLAELRGGDRYDLSASDADLLSALHASGRAPPAHGSRLWRTYKLLQAWDTLSLAFCTTASPPDRDGIDAVPAGSSRPDETLSIDPLGNGEFRVAPYPFGTSPLVVSVPTRVVRKGTFDDEGSLTRVYYESERETETFTLRRNEP